VYISFDICKSLLTHFSWFIAFDVCLLFSKCKGLFDVSRSLLMWEGLFWLISHVCYL